MAKVISVRVRIDCLHVDQFLSVNVYHSSMSLAREQHFLFEPIAIIPQIHRNPSSLYNFI